MEEVIFDYNSRIFWSSFTILLPMDIMSQMVTYFMEHCVYLSYLQIKFDDEIKSESCRILSTTMDCPVVCRV